MLTRVVRVNLLPLSQCKQNNSEGSGSRRRAEWDTGGEKCDNIVLRGDERELVSVLDKISLAARAGLRSAVAPAQRFERGGCELFASPC